MQVAFDALELRDAWLDSDPSARWRLNVALSEIKGTESCSLIYLELDPGCRLPRHTDSAEELVLVLSGSAIASVAERELEVGAGGVVVIPQLAPHELRNSGPGVLRAVGFFATASPVSTFDEPVMPGGTRHDPLTRTARSRRRARSARRAAAPPEPSPVARAGSRAAPQGLPAPARSPPHGSARRCRRRSDGEPP